MGKLIKIIIAKTMVELTLSIDMQAKNHSPYKHYHHLARTPDGKIKPCALKFNEIISQMLNDMELGAMENHNSLDVIMNLCMFVCVTCLHLLSFLVFQISTLENHHLIHPITNTKISMIFVCFIIPL